LTFRLSEYEIHLRENARKIPRGSLRRLRRIFNERPVVVSVGPSEQVELPPLQWETIGNEQEVRYLTAEEALFIHERLEEDFARSADPISPPGVRDEGLLSSAVSRPQTALGSVRKYPTIAMAGAALFHSLVHNHAFHNGNKRTAVVGLLAFLDENGVVITCAQEELFRFTLRTAQHRLVAEGANERGDREVLEIARWIRSHSRQVDKGERPMRWNRLKQRLRDFECGYEHHPGGGVRMNVWRDVSRPRRLGRPKTVRLSTQVACAGDGTDADRSAVHKIRKDLELDDAHDIDSTTFYGGEVIDGFIVDYRRILRRLSKL
jgi:death-on-curing family protein